MRTSAMTVMPAITARRMFVPRVIVAVKLFHFVKLAVFDQFD